jgi:pimeloyl-[acyl-carrier protein] methyl ester esterase
VRDAPQALTPRVLLHGWGFTPQIWQPLQNALSTPSATPNQPVVLTPRLPLTGDLEQDLVALSNTLPENVHLVGWSLGGEVALAYALRFPERVASLTMIASTPCFTVQSDWPWGQPLSLLDDFSQRLADNPHALLKRFGMLIRHGDPQAAKDRTRADQLQMAAETAHDRLANGLSLLRQIDLRYMLSRPAPTPMQLIHGDVDAVVPIAAAIAFSSATTSPCHTLSGGSHALPLTHPKVLAHHLEHFWNDLA